jgi:uncharacterized protein (DUF362 family)
MSGQTRRDFIKQAALAGAALGSMTRGALAQESGGVSAAGAPAAGAPAAGGATVTGGAAKMCIARWKGEATTPEAIKAMAIKLTEQAVTNIGGMESFVKKGDTVWLKPNMAWDRVPETAANTNPDVVGTLVRLCLNAGAKAVKVGDFTCNEASRSYPNSGIEAAVKEAGGQVVYIDETRFRDVEIKGQRLQKWPVYPEIIECDLVINVPVAKVHSVAKATVCMKNYMGIVGGNRNAWHQSLSACLCDITAFMKPRISVVDAIRILTANGPTGGNLADVKQMNMVAAGTDIVALDAWGISLLGLKAEEVEHVMAGEKAGLGTTNYASIAKDIEVA